MEETILYHIESIPKNTKRSNNYTTIDNLHMSVAITYDTQSKYKVWYESEVNELTQHLDNFKHLVGFNNKAHHNELLDHYNPGVIEQLNAKSIDMLEVIEKSIGHKTSLNNVSGPTLDVENTTDKFQATEWWIKGEKEKVEAFCRTNLIIVKQLYEYGNKFQEVCVNYYGQSKEIAINWHQAMSHPSNDNIYIIEDTQNGYKTQLDPDNKKFFQALNLVLQTQHTVYLTGKAGTGKTTLLKYLKHKSNRNVVVLAYTGVAAINADGQTIHSFFQMNPNEPPFLPDDSRLSIFSADKEEGSVNIYTTFKYRKPKRELIQSMDILIIDEVSMVRADMLDTIDKILRAYRKGGYNKPFGGVQILLIGDTFQLAPIEGKSWRILNQFYDGPHFFNAHVLQKHPPIYIELDKIYRQTEQDFVDLLNRVRVNQVTDADIITLNSKYREITDDLFEKNYVILCSLNKQVSSINNERLNAIEGREITYTGSITGEFPNPHSITDIELKLKVGAQIMFLKNGKDYYNGKIGIIEDLHENQIIASTQNNFGEKIYLEVEPAQWDHIEYTYNLKDNKIEQKELGKYTQYPIKLAWAITIHKSQGLTFDKVVVNLSDFSPPGLAYVALSRCTNFNGLILGSPVYRHQFKTDSRVLEFAKHETPDTLLVDMLQQGHADDLYHESKQLLRSNQFDEAYDTFLKALKYRNDLETEEMRQFFKIEYFKYQHYRNKPKAEQVKQSDNMQGASPSIIQSFKERLSHQNKVIQQYSIQLNEERKWKRVYLERIKKLEGEVKRLSKQSWVDRLLGKK